MATVEEYMAKKYTRKIEPSDEGGYIVTYPDLPGIIAHSDDYHDAIKAAEELKEAWFKACIEEGIPIPEPSTENDFNALVIKVFEVVVKGAKQGNITTVEFASNWLKHWEKDQDWVKLTSTMVFLSSPSIWSKVSAAAKNEDVTEGHMASTVFLTAIADAEPNNDWSIGKYDA